MPQICEREPSIRHAVTALGALDFTMDSHRAMHQNTIDNIEVAEHHAFALREYDQAIKLQREQSSKAKVDIQTAIMFCICSICFESFHGNIDSALAQLYSGANLLEEAMSEHGENIENLVLGSSPVPWIERELVMTFRLVGSQGMSFLDPRPMYYHEERHKGFQKLLEDLPPVFLEFKEARFYSEIIKKRVAHFLHLLVQYDLDFDSSAPEKFGWGMFDPVVHPLSYLPPLVFEEQRIHMLSITRWGEAFQPLLEHSRSEAGRSDFILGTTLRLQLLFAEIVVGNALSLLQTSYDAYLAQFSEIVTLTMALLSHPG